MDRTGKLARRPFSRRTGRRFVFAHPPAEPLDLVKPPSYEPPVEWVEKAKADIVDLVEKLKPGAVDAGSREALHNLVNERIEQAINDLDEASGDRLAIASVLVAMASEEVSRLHPGYLDDVAGAGHASTALADTYEELTDRKADESVPAGPAWVGHDELSSTFGRIRLRSASPTDAQPPSDDRPPTDDKPRAEDKPRADREESDREHQ